MNKIYASASAALDGLLFDGMVIAAGGFGLCGIPELLIAAIRDAGTGNLTVARTMPASMVSASANCWKPGRSAR